MDNEREHAFMPSPSIDWSIQPAQVSVQGWLKELIFSKTTGVRTVGGPSPFPDGWGSICDELGNSHRAPQLGGCLSPGVHFLLEVISLKEPLRALVVAQSCSSGFIQNLSEGRSLTTSSTCAECFFSQALAFLFLGSVVHCS